MLLLVVLGVEVGEGDVKGDVFGVVELEATLAVAIVAFALVSVPVVVAVEEDVGLFTGDRTVTGVLYFLRVL